MFSLLCFSLAWQKLNGSMVVAGTSVNSKVCRCTVEPQHPGPQLMAAMSDGGQAKVIATLFTSIMYI